MFCSNVLKPSKLFPQFKMRTDRVSIVEAKAMVNKFFTSNFHLQKVTQHFLETRSRDQVVETLKLRLKEELIDIETELYSAKHIKTLLIYDHIGSNSKMQAELLNIREILDSDKAADLFSYIKYKAQFVLKTRFETIEAPVDPVTSKKKMAIYASFVKHFEENGLFQTELICDQPEKQRNFSSIYSSEEVCKIYQLYDLGDGDLGSIAVKLKQCGYDAEKCRKQSIKTVLINFLTTGIGRVYKISNNLDKFSGCSWEKFQKIHIELMKSLSLQQKKLILRVGIYDNVPDTDIMRLCEKMNIRYKPVGYPKWVKKMDDGTNLYKQQKQFVLSKIKEEMKRVMKQQ